MTRLILKVGAGIAAAMALALLLVFALLGDSFTERMARRMVHRTKGGLIVMCDVLDSASPDELEAERRRMEHLVGMPIRLLAPDDPALADLRRPLVPYDPVVVRDRDGRFEIYIALKHHPKVLALGPAAWRRAVTTTDILVGFGLALAAALLVSLLIVAPMARRIAAVERAASALAAGDLAARAGHGIGGDIVDRLAAHFDHMAARIQAMVEAQQTVLERVSHDLRTPISRLRFNLELLDSPPGPSQDPSAAKQASSSRLRAMEEDLDEMEHLVDEILAYARLKGGARPPDKRPVPVVDVVRNLLAHRPALEAEDGLEVRLEAPRDQSILLACDEHQFRRCLDNLLSNAIRHARTTVSVTIDLPDPGHVRIAVEDDGPGIPPGETEHIFEPFHRLDEDATGQRRASGLRRGAPAPGVGLGLAIVAAILDTHGGTVTAEKSPLGGARFVTLWPT